VSFRKQKLQIITIISLKKSNPVFASRMKVKQEALQLHPIKIENITKYNENITSLETLIHSEQWYNETTK